MPDAVVRHPSLHGNALVGHVGKLDRVVRLGEDRLGQIEADLALVDVEGRNDLDVADPVLAHDRVHDAGSLVLRPDIPVLLKSLHERRGAVSHADNRHFYAVCHRVPSPHCFRLYRNSAVEHRTKL